MYDHKPATTSPRRNVTNRPSRRPYHRWLGRNVAANGNLPLRMVASPAQKPSLSEAEPDACGSSHTEGVTLTLSPAARNELFFTTDDEPTRTRAFTLGHENAEHSKHHRPNRLLENVSASDPGRQAVGSAVWRFNTPRPCSSSQLRSRFGGTSSADGPVFLYAIRAELGTNRAQRTQEGGN